MSDWGAFLRIQAQNLGAVTLVVVTVVGSLRAMGVDIPPWPSVEEFAKLEARVFAMEKQAKMEICLGAGRRLRNAIMRLMQDPNNAAELIIEETARRELSEAGCP